MLLDAGAKPDLARQAAEELAGYEAQFAMVRSDLRLLKWMASANLALTVVVLGSLLVMWARVGELAGSMAQLVHH
ncbi:MAG: hypothetical protein JO227_20795 [Acetobacteraceae bacterium]|nr:hypothetical protein [Acetobacteraceae bacterium]